jgi:hypothetical protein
MFGSHFAKQPGYNILVPGILARLQKPRRLINTFPFFTRSIVVLFSIIEPQIVYGFGLIDSRSCDKQGLVVCFSCYLRDQTPWMIHKSLTFIKNIFCRFLSGSCALPKAIGLTCYLCSKFTFDEVRHKAVSL